MHGSKEGCWSPCQSHGHHLEFKVPGVRLKSCFEFPAFCHSDLIVACSQVQFRELDCPMEFIQKFFNNRNMKLSHHRHSIKMSIINTEPPRAIFLLD